MANKSGQKAERKEYSYQLFGWCGPAANHERCPGVVWNGSNAPTQKVACTCNHHKQNQVQQSERVVKRTKSKKRKKRRVVRE